MGRGGEILITSNSLEVSNGAQLVSETDGIGDAGNISIEVASHVLFDNGLAMSEVEDNAIGTGGNIDINAQSIEVVNGGQLQSGTRGIGQSGNIILSAQNRVVFDGTTSDRIFRSTAFSDVSNSAGGDGGNIEITATSLEIRNGAQLQTSTSGNGNAGNVVINVQDLLLSAENPDQPFNSVILSRVNPLANGSGGNIQVTADSVSFRDGAGAVVGTFGNGDSGNINIFSDSLEILDGAQFQAFTFGAGDAGKVTIEARNRVNLQGTSSSGRPVTIFTSTSSVSGQGNDIWITSPILQIQDGALLLASTESTQSSGDIVLSVGRLELSGGGRIETGSFGGGAAGNVRIDATEGILVSGQDASFTERASLIPVIAEVLEPQSTISVLSSGTGAAGNIVIGAAGTTPEIILDAGGRIIAESAAVDGGNITINLTDLLLLRNGSLISASAGTEQAGGNGGNIDISVPFIIAIPEENSDIAADAFEGTGGNVTINARGVFGIAPRAQRTPPQRHYRQFRTGHHRHRQLQRARHRLHRR